MEGSSALLDGALGTASSDGDGRAVLVHLTVSDLVVPRPREEGLAGLGIGWDGEVVVLLQGAAADDGLDDGEGLALVVAERDLAGSAAVGSSADDADVVRLALGEVGCRPSSVRSEIRVVAFARVVAAIGAERSLHRVVDVGGEGVGLGPERGRKVHLHVSCGAAGKESGHEALDEEGRHFDMCVDRSFAKICVCVG